MQLTELKEPWSQPSRASLDFAGMESTEFCLRLCLFLSEGQNEETRGLLKSGLEGGVLCHLTGKGLQTCELVYQPRTNCQPFI